MDEKPTDEAGWRRWAAAEQEKARRQAKTQEEWWRRRFAAQEHEVIRQHNLIYGGLIGVGVVMVQPFLTATSLELPAMICVVAFSVAIPLLAALVMLNWQETYRRRQSRAVVVEIARAVGQASATVGVVAGFWNILPLAGIGVLVFGIVGIAVHSAGYVRVELDDGKASPDPETEPVDDNGPGGDEDPGGDEPEPDRR